MQEIRTMQQEGAEDIFYGQVVMIWARWFLIAAGIILALWGTTDPIKLAIIIIPVMALIGVNFYLHGRYLTRRPANAALMTAVGLVDIAMITVGVMAWPAGKGIFSPFFILYFPAILAFAFVMPRKVTVAFTVVTLAVYVGASFMADAIHSPKNLYPELYDRAHAQALAPLRAAPAAALPAPAVSTGASADAARAATEAADAAGAEAAVANAAIAKAGSGGAETAKAARKEANDAARAAALHAVAANAAARGATRDDRAAAEAAAKTAGASASAAAEDVVATFEAGAHVIAGGVVKGVQLTSFKLTTVKLMIMRLITLAAMGGLGTYYWRIQRNRRREAAGGAAEEPGLVGQLSSVRVEGLPAQSPLPTGAQVRNDPAVS